MSSATPVSPLSPIAGVILFAHGSRDAQWRAPVEAVACAVRALQPGKLVACAYLELCSPSLAEAVEAMVGEGMCSLRVLPVFFGVGRHAREDLPVLIDELRASYPKLQIELLPAAGEHPLLIALLARMALSDSA